MLIISVGLFYPGIQANTIAISMEDAFGFSPAITGLFVVALLAIVIFGGVKRIAKTSEIIVPFMAIGYVSVALIILILNFSQIPAVFSLIFSSAFGIHATFGGAIGYSIGYGSSTCSLFEWRRGKYRSI